MTGPAGTILSDGRLHLQHGPIDLIVYADTDTNAAFKAAADCFQGLLPQLVSELPILRHAVGPAVEGTVARRMRTACLPFSHDVFVTPMAAVAGAVADHVLAAMTDGANFTKGYVNDGGDIALHLAPGQVLDVGLVADLDCGSAAGTVRIDAASPIRGIATSGRSGRSLSMGIADAVSVFADTAAQADVAATLIANAVWVDSPAIEHRAACSLDPDSDLGDRPAVVSVGPLSPGEIASALDAGLRMAERFRAAGRIRAAVLSLRDATRIAGPVPIPPNRKDAA